jgi:hypothetical protein
VKHDVTEFCGVYIQIKNKRRSRTSNVDVLDDSLELYKLERLKGSSFLFMHCWYLIKDIPK